MFKNIKAAIFDLDGTLIDSMWVWSKIDIDYLSQRGIDFPSDLRKEIEHLSFEDTALHFKKRFLIGDSVEEIMSTWNNIAYKEYLENITIKPGAKEFLHSLKKSGIKIALATSNCYTLLEVALKRFELYEYFDVIVTTDEASRSKAFPDVYLLAAEKLNVTPENCVVFEDILQAVLSAKMAKMMVVAVEDSHSIDDKDEIRNIADIFIKDYLQFQTAV